MAHLSCELPQSLWHALNEHTRETGEPLAHIVARALAQHLDVKHATIFQVSTSSALVEGVYEGAVRVATLRQHGNLGLGTFDHLDGEMVVVDGEFFQVRSDGSVHRVADNVLSPFAVVVHFIPTRSKTLSRCATLADLKAAFDRMRDSQNFFFALRVDGRFSRAHTRAMCRSEEGVPLAAAAAHQPEFDFGPLNLVSYARSFGATGLMAADGDDFRAILRRAWDMAGPVIVGVRVDYRENHRLMESLRPGVFH
jgi:acetolactate decarboxylase